MFQDIDNQFNADLRWLLKELKLEERANNASESEIKFILKEGNGRPFVESQERNLRMLKDRKAITRSPFYSENTAIDMAMATIGGQAMGYFIKIIQPAFDKIIEEIDQNSPPLTINNQHADYWISYGNKGVLLNDSYFISHPQFNSENDNFMAIIISRPNQTLNRKNFEGFTKLKKSFHDILSNMGFTGELRNAFFNVSVTSIRFNNPLTVSDLKKNGINLSKLTGEISSLKKLQDIETS